MKDLQRKAMFAKYVTVAKIKPNGRTITPVYHKTKNGAKDAIKFMKKNKETYYDIKTKKLSKPKSDFDIRKESEFDAGKCVNGKKHCYKRGYKSSSCIHCGDYIGDD